MAIRFIRDDFATLQAWDDLGTGMQLAAPGIVATPGHDGWLVHKGPGIVSVTMLQRVTIRNPQGSSSIGLQFFGPNKRVDCRFYELSKDLVAGTMEDGHVFRPIIGGKFEPDLADGDVFSADVAVDEKEGLFFPVYHCILALSDANGVEKGKFEGQFEDSGIDLSVTIPRIRSHREDQFGEWNMTWVDPL